MQQGFLSRNELLIPRERERESECEGWSEVRRGEVELSSLEVTVDIAAYLRWGSLPCRVALELLRSMPIGVFSLSPSRMFSREKKESETISADVLWICWSLGSPSSDALECSQLVIHSCCCCPFPEK